MMGSDVGVDHEDGPEPDEGEGMAVKGGSADDRNDVVGQGYGQGGEEKAQDIVSIEPGQDGVGHAGDGAGVRVPDGIPEEIAEER